MREKVEISTQFAFVFQKKTQCPTFDKKKRVPASSLSLHILCPEIISIMLDFPVPVKPAMIVNSEGFVSKLLNVISNDPSSQRKFEPK
jgi:hypothetical protein